MGERIQSVTTWPIDEVMRWIPVCSSASQGRQAL